ncbi:cytidylyltransferase domain-containing protein [Haloplanus halophilus]|uniref:cytidylyltransferase domain-containing protein n=1 Tax=Haloplanus halophilus TaxID=2949993 RepID=UPI00203C390E|nr:glycosyltransferase family protein [Haloplanus sp. GDY1]
MDEKVVATIQARMGSTRLPGKVMLPLAGDHVLTHDVRRVETARTIDEVVVATSTAGADDIVARYAARSGATVTRGSETNVLDRLFKAATATDADIVVRITADCPLLDPETVDTVVECLVNTDADYAANILNRSFPRGLDVEAFTAESFERVHTEASTPSQLEHVTPYYHQNEDQFDLVNVASDAVFDEPWMRDRTDLRLTLDEADDYELLRAVYESVSFDGVLPVREAIRYIDSEELSELNSAIEQKEV